MAIVVGKNVLESLTTGMYKDNRIIYREYIQNSSDAIDKAYEFGILEKGKSCIDIKVDNSSRKVTIKDNGTGVQAGRVYKVLGDIGKSEKDFKDQRGFRGIGRLGGLGYCDELKFITSYKGEENKTIATWDCKCLRYLLQPDVEPDKDLIQVVDEVSSIIQEPEPIDTHYFEVQLIGIVKGSSNLLDINEIKDYLSQVAPVPFNYQQFTNLKIINEYLEEHGVTPEEYNIYFENEPIYKPYRRKFLAGNKEKDFIEKIDFFKGYKENGQLHYIGWYGISELSGSIKDNNVSGIRVRKKNILIGDNYTLDPFFGNNPTYRRFNRWFVGELYVFDENLIPNARRDDFEENDAYFQLKESVEKFTREVLAKMPHEASKDRGYRKTIERSQTTIALIESEIDKGLTNSSKEKINKKIVQLDQDLKRIVTKSPQNTRSAQRENNLKKIEVQKEELKVKLENLKSNLEANGEYKVNRLPSSYSKEVRKVVREIFEVIDIVLPSGQAMELQEKILSRLEDKNPKEKD
ncbi:MAG: ATP-binding protein [Ignavibacteriales bacterium]|nr:ATP-binding protein [Ignavibacteriales bacterium]